MLETRAGTFQTVLAVLLPPHAAMSMGLPSLSGQYLIHCTGIYVPCNNSRFSSAFGPCFRTFPQMTQTREFFRSLAVSPRDAITASLFSAVPQIEDIAFQTPPPHLLGGVARAPAEAYLRSVDPCGCRIGLSIRCVLQRTFAYVVIRCRD